MRGWCFCYLFYKLVSGSLLFNNKRWCLSSANNPVSWKKVDKKVATENPPLSTRANTLSFLFLLVLVKKSSPSFILISWISGRVCFGGAAVVVSFRGKRKIAHKWTAGCHHHHSQCGFWREKQTTSTNPNNGDLDLEIASLAADVEFGEKFLNLRKNLNFIYFLNEENQILLLKSRKSKSSSSNLL